jgi:hypothetical protein
MDQLRQLSSRPELLRDEDSSQILDKASETLVGVPAPFGRERIVSALPLAGGPVALATPTMVHDSDGASLADPDGNVIGTPGIVVHRMLSARWTEDTRRLAG